MTTYTAIPDTSIDIDSPVTQPLMTALRDNPIAIAEGSSGAPSIETAAFGTTYYTEGGIGTYCFAEGPTSDVAFGSTASGSDLQPTSALWKADNIDGNGISDGEFDTGTALSGTWKAMGTYDYISDFAFGATTSNGYGATLWLRIS